MKPVGEFDRRDVSAAEESYIFTPQGHTREGKLTVASGSRTARLKVRILDRQTGWPTFCRVNVVGAGGNYYAPQENYLEPYGMKGAWPKTGMGNRRSKAPIRYFGRFFYSNGGFQVDVPEGPVRIEAWKGFEYRPLTLETELPAGRTKRITLSLDRALSMASHGYYGGDPHLHLRRKDDYDDKIILDLIEVEDIRFASILCYNLLDSYTGEMGRQESPQFRGLGPPSLRVRGGYSIMSAQEYRGKTYGHLNLFSRQPMVMAGRTVDPNNWPVYGIVGEETQNLGGYAFHAHGGYAQEILADFAQQKTHGIELLQFGIYRGIGLEGWYRILNTGFRFPASGASDFPACRRLGDCRTYVSIDGEPSFEKWYRAMAEGRSFVTTGPMLLLDVDGKLPGSTIHKTGQGPYRAEVRVRVRSEVVPVSSVQIIVNGHVVREQRVARTSGRHDWLELNESVDLHQSAWIGARAFSRSPMGSPDAEAHTNPVYVYLNGKAMYDDQSLQGLIDSLDRQIAVHEARSFPERSKVLEYFRKSRDILLRIRTSGGRPAPNGTSR